MSDLDRVLYWQGIGESFFNFRGEHVHIPIDNRKQLLTAMGVDVSTAESTEKAAFELDVAPWRAWFPPLLTYRIANDKTTNKEGAFGFDINISPTELEANFSWSLIQNDEVVQQGTFTPKKLPETGNYLYNDIRFTRRFVSMSAVDIGYYQLRVELAEKNATTTYAVAPSQVYQPEWLQNKKPMWGFIIQLYTLRSKRNWGIGDFTDLKTLIMEGVKYGVDLIGLNPFHALLPNVKYNRSPYSPSDRRFINPLYIDVEAVAGYSPDLLASVKIDKTPAQLRDTNEVDYEQCKHLKYAVFHELFQIFYRTEWLNKTSRAEQFLRFQQRHGQALELFSFFEALAADNNNEAPDVDLLAAYGAYASSSEESKDGSYRMPILFHAYLQWLADEQLEECQQLAKSQGMDIGLIRDLAVGADGSGAEVRTNASLFCNKAAIGAPPDPLALQGQNWGLPPMIPASLRATGFAHIIHLLRDNMKNCGALRIDHVMSIMRLWWCPPGRSAEYGAYVHYPLEQIVDLLTLESHLNKCSVIGEDLGIVPDEFRDVMKNSKLLSNKVFYFEKTHNGDFKSPADIAPYAFTTINNHDVPTLTSWWNATDLDLRNTLNILEEGVDFADVCKHRLFEKERLMALLRIEKLLPSSWEERDCTDVADSVLIGAILTLVARVKSSLYAIQLEDLLMMNDPVNVPGTFMEYPNWKRKLTVDLEDMFADTSVCATLHAIHSERQQVSS